jgi:hypothetical protein
MSMPVALDHLSVDDRKALALAVAHSGEPGDYCLAAYYAAARGEAQECESLLAKAGESAEALRAFLEECGVLK